MILCGESVWWFVIYLLTRYLVDFIERKRIIIIKLHIFCWLQLQYKPNKIELIWSGTQETETRKSFRPFGSTTHKTWTKWPFFVRFFIFSTFFNFFQLFSTYFLLFLDAFLFLFFFCFSQIKFAYFALFYYARG